MFGRSTFVYPHCHRPLIPKPKKDCGQLGIILLSDGCGLKPGWVLLSNGNIGTIDLTLQVVRAVAPLALSFGRQPMLRRVLISAASLWDLASFFDTINLGLLYARAVRFDFPLVLLQMAVASYMAPRTVQVRGARAPEIYPTRGIMAGRTFAKALVHLYYMAPVDEFVRLNPVCLKIYIDDITMRCTAKDDDAVLDTLLSAAGCMTSVVEMTFNAVSR